LEILFATSNKDKFAEASKTLSGLGLPVKHFPFDHREIRSDSLEEIARNSVDAAYKRCRSAVFVEDSGLFIDALNGFPGTFSGWVEKKIGTAGILRLMAGMEDRTAHFEAVIAYRDGYGVSVFHGACHGRIAEGARGEDGFGYDPIFMPEGEDQTFAESIELKNKLSHRYKSLLEFSRSLKPRR
jgi:XTP/dITP diphosphohydrolase